MAGEGWGGGAGVHLAHDVGQDSAGGANEGAHNSEQVIAQHEAFSTQGIPTVAVQQGDHHRHVGTCNT